MRGSDSRFDKGQQFEESVFEDLRGWGFLVARNGTEHTHPEFMAQIRQSEDPTSLAIRFEPDGIIAYGSPPVTWYVEAKNSDKLEKTAYEQYMNRRKLGLTLVCVFNCADIKKWAFVEEVKFLDSVKYVNQFPNPFPVTDGWICPRQSNYWHNIKYGNPQGSGTPYKVIDAMALSSWQSFRESFIGKAREQLRAMKERPMTYVATKWTSPSLF